VLVQWFQAGKHPPQLTDNLIQHNFPSLTDSNYRLFLDFLSSSESESELELEDPELLELERDLLDLDLLAERERERRAGERRPALSRRSD
jgi:hypothetical protein